MPLHPKIEEAERELDAAIREWGEAIATGTTEELRDMSKRARLLDLEAEEAHRLYGEGK